MSNDTQRADQIVYHFYTKLVLVVNNARSPQEPNGQAKIDKWVGILVSFSPSLTIPCSFICSVCPCVSLLHPVQPRGSRVQSLQGQYSSLPFSLHRPVDATIRAPGPVVRSGTEQQPSPRACRSRLISCASRTPSKVHSTRDLACQLCSGRLSVLWRRSAVHHIQTWYRPLPERLRPTSYSPHVESAPSA